MASQPMARTGDDAEEMRDLSASVTYGWGMVPVGCRINDTRFTTSLWPKDGAYYHPLKAVVRSCDAATAPNSHLSSCRQ